MAVLALDAHPLWVHHVGVKTPSHSLERIRAAAAAGELEVTGTAGHEAAEVGYGYEEICAVVAALTPRRFVKSVESTLVEGEWQDVYKVPIRRGKLFVKVTITAEVLVLSFRLDWETP